MTSKEKLYRVIYLALLEIRGDSNISNDKKTFEISNLIHNLPLKLSKSEEQDYDKILSDLIDSASNNKGLTSWLKNNSIDI